MRITRSNSVRECVFLVTHLVPYPPTRGVELRIYRLLRWLREEGHKVILIVPAESLDEHTLTELRKVTHEVHWTRPAFRTRLGQHLPLLRQALWEPLKPLIGKAFSGNGASGAQENEARSVTSAAIKQGLCPDSLVRLVGTLAHKYRPAAVIAEYIFLMPCFANLPPETLKIVDTIDVFSRKQDQVLAYGVDDPYACTAAEEHEALQRADTVLAIQSKEAELLRALAPEREVLLVGMDFDAVSQLHAGKPNTISVVGADNALNVHGLRGFLAECWPQIKTAHSAAVLNIIGKVGDQCRVEDPAVHYTRWIDDLDGVYRDARVVINPTIAGTGLKIKSAEALAHGKPLVLWPHGADGLAYDGASPYIVCRSWQEFSQAVVGLLQSETEAKELATRALSYASTHFAAGRVYAPLRSRLVEHLSLQANRSSVTSKPIKQASTDCF